MTKVTHGRDPYDEDDRVRCVCVHVDTGAYAKSDNEKVRCTALTRHPSGLCHDCRPFAEEGER